jgi:DNA repair photolyase
MKRRTMFVPYRPKTILNKSKRADHLFWSRYSAYPYIGCQHGCEFCYCREEKYYPYEDVLDFPYLIKVKENAPTLLRRGLQGQPVDVVFTGDYQPAERKFEISRRMLEVCLDLGFPILVLERSPLVLRDLDLLQAIQDRAVAVVLFSIVSTPDSPGYERVRQLERLAPPAEKRFAAMERIAAAGILTGTCMMPILPGLCDDEETLENVVRWTADHGGRFVIAGGLTLADQQRAYFFDVLSERLPDLVDFYAATYPPGSYGPPRDRWLRIARRIHEFCQATGISDRMPRPIIPGDKRTLNKRVAERLAYEAYRLELADALPHEIWAYRRAAWAVEDLEPELGLVCRIMGRKGLESIENVGPRMAQTIETLIRDNARFLTGAGKDL